MASDVSGDFFGSSPLTSDEVHGNAAHKGKPLQRLSECLAQCSRKHETLSRPVRSVPVGRVKKNVHVTLAFSPVGDSFRNRLRALAYENVWRTADMYA